MQLRVGSVSRFIPPVPTSSCAWASRRDVPWDGPQPVLEQPVLEQPVLEQPVLEQPPSAPARIPAPSRARRDPPG
ncbi:hypothetical protein ACWD3J_34005 [Streptomyces sp. NPDC002755]